MLTSITLFRKEIRRFMEVWLQTLAAPIVSNLLFLIVFGSVVGAAAGGGPEYLKVLIPGLAAMGIVMNAFGNPLGSIMLAKYTNAIQELLMLPVRGYEVAFAYVAASALRGCVVAVITVIVGLFFVQLPFANIPVILLFAIMIGGIFGSAGVVTSIVAKDFDQASVVQNFFLQPLLYLGGVFYAVGSLPGMFQTLSRFNPIFYMIDGFRAGFLGVSDAPLWLSFIVTFICFLAAFGAASYILETGYKLRA